ncbi:uncharacterized protein LOC141708553 [Apium graveolens]|uniref:uncharacterized protein LOC141708553 n=1 Tax=Apium graveolens TaxID=4045 RepID=UPI003D7B79FC
MASVTLPSDPKMSEIVDVSFPSQETPIQMASVFLPKFILLKSRFSPNLLGCVKGNPDSIKDYVKFYAERVGMLEAKFEVHRSATGNGMVHIRNCYNNRYLVLNDTNDAVVAKAETTEEDQSKRSCTLFRPTGNANSTRLINVHLGKNVSFWRTTGLYEGCLLAQYTSNAADLSDVFNVIDWESLVILPRYVAFQNANKFLKSVTYKKHEHLQFDLNKVDDNPILSTNEIIQTANSSIHIRSLHFQKYWNERGWIRPELVTPDNTTLFEAIKLTDDTIALKTVAVNRFCNRVPNRDNKKNYLARDPSSIIPESRFKVVEAVSSRTISNYQYHLMNARIYNETIDTMSEKVYSNNTSTPELHAYMLQRLQRTTTTWSSSISIRLTATATARIGIPFIKEGKVTVESEYNGELTWNKTTVDETKTTHSYLKMVPAGKKVTMRMVATNGTCDVPFSYTQRDVLYTGETVVTVMDDGIFTGANFYSYKVESLEEPLVKNPGDMETEPEWKPFGMLSPSGKFIPIEEGARVE